MVLGTVADVMGRGITDRAGVLGVERPAIGRRLRANSSLDVILAAPLGPVVRATVDPTSTEPIRLTCPPVGRMRVRVVDARGAPSRVPASVGIEAVARPTARRPPK